MLENGRVLMHLGASDYWRSQIRLCQLPVNQSFTLQQESVIKAFDFHERLVKYTCIICVNNNLDSAVYDFQKIQRCLNAESLVCGQYTNSHL